MNTKKHLTALAAATVLLLGATACGSTPDHDDADVTFATDMVAHHRQALEMVDLTEGRTLDPQVAAVVTEIEDAQTPELATMTGWLKDWDEPVPSSSEMSGMSGMSEGHDMPGMMSADAMTSLADAPDAAFSDLWLRMMIEHHEGAVTMAETEKADGSYQPAVDLATSIASSQTDEIARMKALLGQS